MRYDEAIGRALSSTVAHRDWSAWHHVFNGYQIAVPEFGEIFARTQDGKTVESVTLRMADCMGGYPLTLPVESVSWNYGITFRVRKGEDASFDIQLWPKPIYEKRMELIA